MRIILWKAMTLTALAVGMTCAGFAQSAASQPGETDSRRAADNSESKWRRDARASERCATRVATNRDPRD